MRKKSALSLAWKIIISTFLLYLLCFSNKKCTGAWTNLTTNELVKKKKKQPSYDYLNMSTRWDGSPTSIFDKGCFYNIKSYFHCVEASPLESENQGTYDYYDVWLAEPHFFSYPCSSGMRKNFFSDYLWGSIIVFFVLLEIKVRLE